MAKIRKDKAKQSTIIEGTLAYIMFLYCMR